MKLIKPKFEIIEQSCYDNECLLGMYKQIEKCGRTCYKSEDKITDESAWPFVNRMIKSEHYAMLEHGTVYLTVPERYLPYMQGDYENEPHTRINFFDCTGYITTNFRVIIENGWLDDLEYISAPTEHHELRVTVKFTVDIGVTREFNRHRVNSMAEQSTRYCNYAKEKFGAGITFLYLPWCDTDDAVEPEHQTMSNDTILPYNTSNWNAVDWWLWSISAAETAYLKLIELGWQPQQARAVLPLNTQSELIHTAFVSDWMHFFDLRAHGTTGSPHPQAREIAIPVYEEFVRRGLTEYNVDNIISFI